MILKIGTEFKLWHRNYKIVGQGSTVHHLQLCINDNTITEMHIDKFNELYENGEIKLIETK
jgi:hypothetical protein